MAVLPSEILAFIISLCSFRDLPVLARVSALCLYQAREILYSSVIIEQQDYGLGCSVRLPNIARHVRSLTYTRIHVYEVARASLFEDLCDTIRRMARLQRLHLDVETLFQTANHQHILVETITASCPSLTEISYFPDASSLPADGFSIPNLTHITWAGLLTVS